MQLNSVIGSPAYRTVHHWLMRCEKRPMIEETDFLVNTYVLGLQMWFMVMNVVLMANLHYFRHLILAKYDRDDRLKWRLLNRRQIVLHKLRREQENKNQSSLFDENLRHFLDNVFQTLKFKSEIIPVINQPVL